MNEVLQKLPHWKDFKRNYPDELLSGNQVATLLNRSAKVEFYTFMENYRFSDLVLKKDVHFIGRNRIAVPKGCIQDLICKVEELCTEFEVLNNDPTLIHDDEMFFRHPVRRDLLRIKLSTGEWGYLIYAKALNSTGREMLFFKKNEMEKAIHESNLKTFLQVSKEIPSFPAENTLQRMFQKGEIVQPKYLQGTSLWEMKDLIQQVQNRGIIKSGPKPKVLRVPSFLDKLIKEYADERTTGTRIKDPFGTTSYKRKITAPKEHIRILTESFYKIFCNRAGIEIRNRALMDETGVGYRSLTEEEQNRLQPIIISFTMESIQKSDIVALIKSYTNHNGSYAACSKMRPFILWWFNQFKAQWDHSTLEKRFEFDNFYNRFEEIDNLLLFDKEETPIEDQQIHVFLNHEQIVRSINCLRKVSARSAAMWGISCFVGLRPSEIRWLRLEHFKDPNPLAEKTWLDENGYLKPDPSIKPFYDKSGKIREDFGYVRLFFPRKFCKGKKTNPDAERNGQLIPPHLVSIINDYLSELYAVSPVRGKGFLFRANKKNPERKLLHAPYNVQEQLRKLCTFLPEAKRNVLELKDGRRSMNKLILDGIYSEKKIAYLPILRAGQRQMKHVPSGETAEINYHPGVIETQFITIIDEALNFPLDLGELMIWEVEKGYRQKSEVLPEYLHLFGEADSNSKELIDSLDDVILDEKDVLNKLSSDKKAEYNLLIRNKEEVQKKYKLLSSIHNMRVDKRKEAMKKYKIKEERVLIVTLKSLEKKLNQHEEEIVEWLIENS